MHDFWHSVALGIILGFLYNCSSINRDRMQKPWLNCVWNLGRSFYPPHVKRCGQAEASNCFATLNQRNIQRCKTALWMCYAIGLSTSLWLLALTVLQRDLCHCPLEEMQMQGWSFQKCWWNFSSLIIHCLVWEKQDLSFRNALFKAAHLQNKAHQKCLLLKTLLSASCQIPEGQELIYSTLFFNYAHWTTC